MRSLLIILFLFSFNAFSQTTDSLTPPSTSSTLQAAAACPECPKNKCPDCARLMEKTETYRDDSFGSLMVGYQYVSTWVVGKVSGSYTQIINRTWSAELEYVTSERTAEIGEFELGRIKEERYTLFAKYYLDNSFHFSAGPYYFSYDINTAGSLRNLADQEFKDTWNISGLGVAFAFGNRWQTKWGLTWGFDWVRLNYPLYTTWINKDSGEVESATRGSADRSFDVIRKVPTFAVFTVKVGWTF